MSISGLTSGISPSFTTEPVTSRFMATHLSRALLGVAPGPLIPEPGIRFDGGTTGPGGLCGACATAYTPASAAAAIQRFFRCIPTPVYQNLWGRLAACGRVVLGLPDPHCAPWLGRPPGLRVRYGRSSLWQLGLHASPVAPQVHVQARAEA